MDISSDQFITFLRSALHNLYEPGQLHRSPLAHLFGVAGRVDASSALQEILLKAIDGLRPDNGESQQSLAWIIYEVLYFRYVLGYEREVVANQLGISDRQLSREQRTAIEALAQRLWKAYQLDSQTAALTPAQGSPAGADWVEALPAEKPAPWKAILISVLDLLSPLAREQRVSIHCAPLDDLPDLLAPQAAMRHSLLNLLGWLIPLAGQGELTLTPAPVGGGLLITARILGRRIAGEAPDPAVVVARQLIERVGGRLDLDAGAEPPEARLFLPTLAQVPVLVIDDNPDMIQLFQRYAQGSRYSVIGLQQPVEALPVIEKIDPRIIVMDVMMPEIDGWDLLTRLRASRQAQGAAIIICSILPQQSLALSLGADGFLQKPVLPQDFLAALDRQMEEFPAEPGSL